MIGHSAQSSARENFLQKKYTHAEVVITQPLPHAIYTTFLAKHRIKIAPNTRFVVKTFACIKDFQYPCSTFPKYVTKMGKKIKIASSEQFIAKIFGHIKKKHYLCAENNCVNTQKF